MFCRASRTGSAARRSGTTQGDLPGSGASGDADEGLRQRVLEMALKNQEVLRALELELG